jgi:hypothetical protein
VAERLLDPALAVGVRADRGRLAGRGLQQRHGLPAPACFEPVVRDPLRRRAATGKRHGGVDIGAGEPVGGEPPASGVAQQRMAKAHAIGGALEDPRAHAGVQRSGRDTLVDPRERGQFHGAKAVLQNGKHGNDRCGLGRQPGDPGVEQIVQLLRHAHPAGGIDRGGQLLREERIAGGGRLDRARGLRGQRALRGATRDPPRRRRRQRREHDIHGGAPLAQAGAHAHEPGRDLAGARGRDEHHSLAPGDAREVVHDVQRGLVGRVEVLQDDHDAALARRRGEQLAEPGQQLMTLGRPPLAAVRPARHRRREQAQHLLRAVRESCDEIRAREKERLQRLHDRPVGNRPLLVMGDAAQRVPAAALAVGEHDLGDARLSHPRIAEQEQRASASTGGRPHRLSHRGQLAVTSLDGGVEEQHVAHRRTARDLRVQRDRLFARLQAQPRELVAQRAELARRRQPVAG